VGGPILNLVLFLVAAAFAAVLLWPRFGLLPGFRRRRHENERIRVEDALKHLYGHEYRGSTATLTSIGGAVGVGAARALELVQSMQRGGLVTTVDGRILLTGEGRRHALQVIRAHRLWERYLADETGVGPLKWHEQAERREHVLTPDDADALSERLGDPKFDPHGDPIPTREGELPDVVVPSLAGLKVGEEAQVIHVEDEPHVVYEQLVALGVYVGMEVRVVARSDERLIVESEGRSLVMAPIVAGNVSVRRLSEQEKAAIASSSDTLADLDEGTAAEVVRISPACRGLERRRLMDLGILPGTRISFERKGLTGGLAAYRVRGTLIALREEQANMISIQRSEGVGS
jgi:DtxR family Mn-dependent transcriptional regulator